MLKKIISIFVTALLLFSFSSAFASSDIEANKSVSDGSTIKEIVMVKDGIATKIDYVSYIKAIEAQNKQNISKQSLVKNINMQDKTSFKSSQGVSTLYDGATYVSEVYNESVRINDYVCSGDTKRISSIIENSTSSAATFTINYSASQSYSANITVNASYKSIIGGVLGGSWTKTVSGSSSIAMQIASGKYGWMEYTPIMINSWGFIKREESYDYGRTWFLISNTYVDLYIAKENAGRMPDGYYILRESSTRPV